MTIEVNGNEIWVRCGSGDDQTICIDFRKDGVRINAHPEPGSEIETAAAELFEWDDDPIAVAQVVIDPIEAVALAHAILEQVRRMGQKKTFVYDQAD
ncbi:hypothetical protein [Pararhodobacter sp.]|uniref:hypothetical protein n=1 Tax=Pararhodobacter sp. TaxID=2127056 RepID=UPI002FDD36EC